MGRAKNLAKKRKWRCDLSVICEQFSIPFANIRKSLRYKALQHEISGYLSMWFYTDVTDILGKGFLLSYTHTKHSLGESE